MSANISVGAKHYGGKSLLITNKSSAVMLRPSNIGMLRILVQAFNSALEADSPASFNCDRNFRFNNPKTVH